MKSMKNCSYLFLFKLILLNLAVSAQNAEIREEAVPLITYPFSDPSMVPEPGRIYPYFRFDGYTDKGIVRDWKMIVLENKYIKIWVNPQVGGKIWGAVEKSTGRDFIYFNHAVKFRDVAMRGPWTSGGLEFNFGLIGHGPSCAHPVDYFTRTNTDGSVSCFIGYLDLPSRTRWMVEINLPPDKAYFTTRSVWDNPTAMDQSYYHWTNLGIKTTGNLEYQFSGNKYIGHDGKSSPWPVDDQGRDLHFYENNNFGNSKSYHVLGELTNFYGGFWHKDNFGFGHYATFDDKPGKKIWIWGLSGQGMNWVRLLTDADGQYTELQSGRSFNQANEASSQTPFKNRSLKAGSTDEWTEYWFPVNQTHGLISALPEGSVNLLQQGDTVHVWFCPNERIDKRLEVRNGKEIIFTRDVHADPMETVSASIQYKDSIRSLSIWIGNGLLFDADHEKYGLKRPVEAIGGFNWETAYGHYVKGKEMERQRWYDKAGEEYKKSLAVEPTFVPSLTGIANIYYRQSDYQSALKYALLALSVDTYDGYANMNYGMAGLALGDTISAIDGFSIASSDISQRCAAYNSLASIYIHKGDFLKANAYAGKSLLCNQLGTEATQLKIVTLRKMKDYDQADSELIKLETRDPLNHFIRFERYLRDPSANKLEQIRKYISNEFSGETYLEHALWYYRHNQLEDALSVLDCVPENQPVIFCWKGYLNHLSGREKQASDELGKALRISPNLVFPFRQETLKALEWAQGISTDWKLKYYAGLINLNAGATAKSLALLASCGDTPEFYPFYVVRSRLWNPGSEKAQSDVNKVMELVRTEWRAGLFASKYYLDHGNYRRSEEIARKYFEVNTKNYYLGLHYAKMLEYNRKYTDCIELLGKITVLPNEGATEGRTIWRNANIGKALDYFEAKKYRQALESIDNSKKWPDNLGVGKPYEVDERFEDFISMQCLLNIGDHQSAKELSDRIIHQPAIQRASNETYDFLAAWLWKESGNKAKGDSLMNHLIKRNPASKNSKWYKAIYSGELQEAKKYAGEPDRNDQLFIFLRRIFDPKTEKAED